MIYKEESNGPKYEPIPAGSYAARCYKIIYLGTQNVEYMGVAKRQNKMKIVWELPTEMKVFKEGEEARPYSISKTYTISLYEKASLRADLAGWRGNDFTEEEIKNGIDFNKLVGVSCLLSVVHKKSTDGKKTYALIASISRLPKGMVCPAPVNPQFIFEFDGFDPKKLEMLNKFDQEKIKSSPEYLAVTSGAVASPPYEKPEESSWYPPAEDDEEVSF